MSGLVVGQMLLELCHRERHLRLREEVPEGQFAFDENQNLVHAMDSVPCCLHSCELFGDIVFGCEAPALQTPTRGFGRHGCPPARRGGPPGPTMHTVGYPRGGVGTVRRSRAESSPLRELSGIPAFAGAGSPGFYPGAGAGSA